MWFESRARVEVLVCQNKLQLLLNLSAVREEVVIYQLKFPASWKIYLGFCVGLDAEYSSIHKVIQVCVIHPSQNDEKVTQQSLKFGVAPHYAARGIGKG